MNAGKDPKHTHSGEVLPLSKRHPKVAMQKAPPAPVGQSHSGPFNMDPGGCWVLTLAKIGLPRSVPWVEASRSLRGPTQLWVPPGQSSPGLCSDLIEWLAQGDSGHRRGGYLSGGRISTKDGRGMYSGALQFKGLPKP
jgi:hypothetical protein